MGFGLWLGQRPDTAEAERQVRTRLGGENAMVETYFNPEDRLQGTELRLSDVHFEEEVFDGAYGEWLFARNPGASISEEYNLMMIGSWSLMPLRVWRRPG